MGMGGGLNSDGYFLSKAGQFWTTVIGTGEVTSPTVRSRKLPSLFGFAAEVQVARMVDFAHAAGAKGRQDFVRAQARAGREGCHACRDSIAVGENAE